MFLWRLLKNRRLMLFVLIIVVLGALINVTSKDPDMLNKIGFPVLSVINPVQKLFTSTSYTISDAIYTFSQVFTLKSENEELKKQLAQLKNYKREYLEFQHENKKLREMLNLKQRNSQYDLEAAEVIGRDPGNWFNVILINKGEKDGIKKDMAVMVEEGLVGYIIDAGPASSKVLLITDERSSVSAMIQRTRDNGIVKGSIDSVPQGHVKIVFLPHDSNITNGDIVISSGLGGIIPKGIVIGEVVEAKKELHGLTQYAIVKPAVNLQKLEIVFVVKS